MSKRVAVVGAGASGLTAIKSCLEEELVPVCYERTNEIGGLWNFTPNVREGQACVMKSTIINSSKEMMTFSDFPPPKEFATFMHNSKVLEYFKLYAEKFNLLKHIEFQTEILNIYKTDDFASTGRWIVEVKYKKSGETKKEVFDGVVVCTGHHADPHIPSFPGDDMFQGEKLHTHDYKEPRGYEDKRVVVIGMGNSAGDVAVELSRCAKQVYLSTRRGSWVTSRIGTNGMPGDMEYTRRFGLWVTSWMSADTLNTQIEKGLNKKFDHAKYGLKPTHRFTQQHPMVNDDLANRIASGTIMVKPDVKTFTKTGIEFVDGTFEDDVDVVLCGTGYKFGYPFLSKEVVKVENNTKVNLYKYVFPPDLEQHTLAIIGLVQPIGSTVPTAEIQNRWAARVIKRTCKLPTPVEMWKDIETNKTSISRRYLASQRHTLQVDLIPYMDDIAEQIGCKPDISKLFLSDPSLGKEVYFGPCTPYQYRLHGPGPWSGAREAILTQWDRTYPFGKIAQTESSSHIVLYVTVLVVVLAIVMWWMVD